MKRLKVLTNRFFDNDALAAFVVTTSDMKIVTATRWPVWGGFRRFLRREIPTTHRAQSL